MKVQSELLAKMHNILDSKSTHPFHPSDSREDDSDDEDLPPHENANFNKALEELNEFE